MRPGRARWHFLATPYYGEAALSGGAGKGGKGDGRGGWELSAMAEDGPAGDPGKGSAHSERIAHHATTTLVMSEDEGIGIKTTVLMLLQRVQHLEAEAAWSRSTIIEYAGIMERMMDRETDVKERLRALAKQRREITAEPLPKKRRKAATEKKETVVEEGDPAMTPGERSGGAVEPIMPDLPWGADDLTAARLGLGICICGPPKT